MGRTKDRPLSGVMAGVLGETIEYGGKLVRHAGGFWTYPGCLWTNNAPDWHAGTTTVNALVTRGRLRYTEWRQGSRDRFPIAAEVVDAEAEAEAA